MKEIKAYIKLSVLHDVVAALNKGGYCCMTIIDVAGLGALIDPAGWKYSLEFVEKASKIAKIELVCSEEQAGPIIDIIKHCGKTNERGDGIIYVSSVERAIKIRTGEEGGQMLQK